MIRSLPASIVALLVASVVACGGKTALDDFSAGTTGTGTGSGAGGGSGTGGLPGGSGGGSAGTGGTSGSVSVPPSAGPAPASAAITCGKSSCNLTTQDCCIQDASGVGSCTAKGSCKGLALSCTSSANCVNGEVCCVQLDQGSQSAACQTSCDSAPGGGPGGDPGGGPGDPGGPDGDGNGGPGDPGGSFQLCASTAECAKGETCQRTPLGFGVCLGRRGKGPPPPPKH